MEQAACDQEIRSIVGAAGASMDTEDISRSAILTFASYSFFFSNLNSI